MLIWAAQTLAEGAGLLFIDEVHNHPAVGELERCLDAVGDSALGIRLHHESINHHRNIVLKTLL